MITGFIHVIALRESIQKKQLQTPNLEDTYYTE